MPSFNKAAEESFITPTAVIKQINLLEASLDVQLFERTHRGIVLTKAGKSLYQDAKYVIQYSKEAVIRAQNAMQENTDVIRIGTSPMTPVQFLMQLWPKIQENCPGMKFQITFENTPENARNILSNLGQNIDVVGGIFDETMLRLRGCAGLELFYTPLCCAVSVYHPLAEKNILRMEDLYGQNLMLMRRNWSMYVDRLRDDIWQNHPQINIIDFDFYDVNVFNRCENGNDILMAVSVWENVHPLLKIIPVEWKHSIPYGLLHSQQPSDTVKRFLEATKKRQNKKEYRIQVLTDE